MMTQGVILFSCSIKIYRGKILTILTVLAILNGKHPVLITNRLPLLPRASIETFPREIKVIYFRYYTFWIAD